MGPVVSMPAAEPAPEFPIPIFATAAWIAAVTACGGVCQCAGQCGRKHTATRGRCDRE